MAINIRPQIIKDNRISFSLNTITNNINKNSYELGLILMDAVSHQTLLCKESLQNYISIDNNDNKLDTFIKCFNSVNHLPISRYPLRVWKYYDDKFLITPSYQIQCTSKELPNSAFVICDVMDNAIIFDAWRCNL